MKFQGTTEEALGPFLGADFWKKGAKIEGVIQGNFETSNGMSWSVLLRKPVTVKGEEKTVVSLGNLTGFMAALRAARIPDAALLAGDAIIVECTGLTKATKPGYSDQPNFRVVVDRQ